MTQRFLLPVVAVLCLLVANARAQTPGAYLGELSWLEAVEQLEATPLVIIPFGAGAKEHGPHLPMNADQKVMEYLCQQAVDSLHVLVAPRGFANTPLSSNR